MTHRHLRMAIDTIPEREKPSNTLSRLSDSYLNELGFFSLKEPRVRKQAVGLRQMDRCIGITRENGIRP